VLQPHAAIFAAVAVLAVGCSGSEDKTEIATPPPAAGVATTPPGAPSTAPASSGGAEPQTETGVRAVATDEFDSFAGGDYGGAWDLFYGLAKKLISRADYIRLFKLCPDPAPGVRFQIEKISMGSGGEAQVRVSRLGLADASYRFVYESGHWRFVPTAQAMNDYSTKKVEQIASDERAQGGCGKR
jgi:hypothetical protein